MAGSKPGPKPKPKPAPEVIPELEEEALHPLKQLSDRALEVWEEELPHLRKFLISRADVAVFSRYCECIARIEEMEEAAEDQPFTVAGAYGNIMKNPIFQMIENQDKLLASLAHKLGMTPTARKILKGQMKDAKPVELPSVPDEVARRRERLDKKARGH
ncbi:MAG: phage terminase small subunit P27 family [Candidatus Obscuribacterales bacterium]|nr:phage terminase small subunit P27 family [Candidatus Obscuribacterales bacterium]